MGFPEDFNFGVFLVVAGEGLVLVILCPLDAGHVGEPVEAGEADLGPFAVCVGGGSAVSGHSVAAGGRRGAGGQRGCAGDASAQAQHIASS